MPTEKRAFTGTAMSTNKQVNGTTNPVGQKIKNFFRLSSLSAKDGLSLSEKNSSDSPTTPRSDGKEKSSLRQSRFLPHLGRNRSQTVASEGDMLEQGMSPTAHANPYFQHQGPPALRHHNDSSVPPSPPDTPNSKKENAAKGNAAALAGKEELARKLRRVASAPNAQGMFAAEGNNGNKAQQITDMNSAVKTVAPTNASTSALAIIDSNTSSNGNDLLPVPGLSPGKLRDSIAFRRTYSSNSIKVRNVEVGPGSFDKIKLIGKGDVGKVYLVREKKSARLYAMKGK